MNEFRQGDVLTFEQANMINNAFACIKELQEHAKNKNKETSFNTNKTAVAGDEQ